MDSQAQPTQRRKTTSTLRPPPSTSFPSRSRGAGAPTGGHSGATGTGGGTGDSHACAVSGRFRTVIHLAQAGVGSSSRSSLAGGAPPLLAPFLGAGSPPPKFRASLGMPIFFMASFVPRLENILLNRLAPGLGDSGGGGGLALPVGVWVGASGMSRPMEMLITTRDSLSLIECV